MGKSMFIFIFIILLTSLVFAEIFPPAQHNVNVGTDGSGEEFGVNVFIQEPSVNTSTLEVNHSDTSILATYAQVWITNEGNKENVADILLSELGNKDHDVLDNLNWAAAGHTIDTNVDAGVFSFLGVFNWTSANDFNEFTGTTLTFNNTRLIETIENITATITYLPYNITLNAGTLDAGNLTSILAPKDGDTYNISEASGASPLIVQINFTGVETFSTIVLREKYSGGAGHQIAIGVYECGDGIYEEEYEPHITDMDDFAYTQRTVFDPTSHICGDDNNVSIQLRHVNNGISSHDFFLDYAILQSGATTIVSEESDPFAFHKSGDVIMEGNSNWGGFNFTNADWINAITGNFSGQLSVGEAIQSGEVLSVLGATGVSAGEDGEAVSIVGGVGVFDANAGDGGNITLTSGDGGDSAGVSPNGNGGDVLITSGDSGTGGITGASGDIILDIGTGFTFQGIINLSGYTEIKGDLNATADAYIGDDVFVGDDLTAVGNIITTDWAQFDGGIGIGIDQPNADLDSAKGDNPMTIRAGTTVSGADDDMLTITAVNSGSNLARIRLVRGSAADAGKIEWDIAESEVLTNAMTLEQNGDLTMDGGGDITTTGNITGDSGFFNSLSATNVISVGDITAGDNLQGYFECLGERHGAGALVDFCYMYHFVPNGTAYYSGVDASGKFAVSTTKPVAANWVSNWDIDIDGNMNLGGGNLNNVGSSSYVNDCGIGTFSQSYERGSVSSNQQMALGNGDILRGFSACSSGTISVITGVCENCAVGTTISMEATINDVVQACDTTTLDSAYDTSHTRCDVDFVEGDLIGCKTKTEVGSVTGIVCTISGVYG